MSDERFDDAVREALLTDDPGSVPGRLRARMARIPDEEGQRGATGWRHRLTALAVPAAVLAAAVVVAVLFGGIALHGQEAASAVPTVPPSAPVASAAASVQSASGPASITPSATPSGPIRIVASQVTGLMAGTFAIRDNVGYVRSMADTVSWPTLLAVDLGSSQQGGILVALENGHDIASYALTDAGIVWIETWYTQPAIDCGNRTPCSPHEYQPVSWALNLTTFDKQTTRLDSGVVSRTSVEGEVAGPLPPEMAAQGDRVAYAVPRATVPGAPEASQILVRSLPDGSLVRRIDTDGYVAQIGMSGQAVAFRSALDVSPGGGVDPWDATLYATAADGQEPVVVAAHVADVAIGDGGVGGPTRLAWAPDDQNHASVYVEDLGAGPPTVVKATAGTSGPASQLIVVGDGVAWIAQAMDASGAGSSLVNAWHPGWSEARAVPAFGSPDTIGVTGTQLLVAGGSIADLGGGPAGAIPASAIVGTTP